MVSRQGLAHGHHQGLPWGLPEAHRWVPGWIRMQYPSPGLLELLWLARLCWHGGCCSPVAAVELNMFSMHRALCA